MAIILGRLRVLDNGLFGVDKCFDQGYTKSQSSSVTDTVGQPGPTSPGDTGRRPGTPWDRVSDRR